MNVQVATKRGDTTRARVNRGDAHEKRVAPADANWEPRANLGQLCDDANSASMMR